MYPIAYEADYLRERNRLTTFFRYILAIPWYIVNAIYGIAALVVVIIAWFGLVILGRYPQWAYDFVSGVLRYTTRYNAWFSLQTDEFPPFGLGADPTYPVRLQVAQRAEKQSRLKAFFRGILLIPLYFVAFAVGLVHAGASYVAWMTIVFRGYQPAGVHNALAFSNAWVARVTAYSLMLRDEYPPVGDEPVQVGDVKPSPPPPPPQPAAS
jgi:hypothetical protein